MFRRELLNCFLCPNPFGPELCYDIALRLAGYRAMLMGDTWVHHNHDYSQKESYGFTGDSPEKIKQREYIESAIGHLTFGLTMFGDICVFEKQTVSGLSPPKAAVPRLLSVDVRAGQGLLDLKNQLRTHGVFYTHSTAFTTDARHYPLLYTMADEVLVAGIDALDSALGSRRFDYCIVGAPVGTYPHPETVVSVLQSKLNPGGEIFYK
jgi:hypothetical protein